MCPNNVNISCTQCFFERISIWNATKVHIFLNSGGKSKPAIIVCFSLLVDLSCDTLSNTCEHSVIQKLSYLKNLGFEAKIITVCFLISGPKILK